MKSIKPRRAKTPALEWICDLSGQTARITSIGNRSLLVENHCGILEFTDERIILSTQCGCIEITGNGLFLGEVRLSSLVIHGDIRNVKLPCREGSAHEP